MSTGSTLLDRLRDDTRELHESLEKQLPLTNPDLTLEQYRHTLERFYSFYQPFETDVMPRLPREWAKFFQNRAKLPALTADLEFVGSSNSQLFASHNLPAYTSLPAIFGALYVVEGSTLGGQLITRHVQQVLGLSENEGIQFFSSYGTETGSRWKSFRELLLRYSTPEHDDEIVKSARRTFQALHGCLLGAHDVLTADTAVATP